MDLTRGNPSLRESLQMAFAMGCFVGPVNRTGEVVVKHPDGVQKCRVNSRKKDAPKKLLVMLRTLECDRSRKPNQQAAPVAAAVKPEEQVNHPNSSPHKRYYYKPTTALMEWLHANITPEVAVRRNVGEHLRERIIMSAKAELLNDANGKTFTNQAFLTLCRKVSFHVLAGNRRPQSAPVALVPPAPKPQPATVSQASTGVIAAARAARCMRAAREAVNVLLDLAEKGDVASIEAVVELLKENQS